MKNLKRGIIVFFCLLPIVSFPQSMRDIKLMVDNTPREIIDYGYDVNENTRVPFKGILKNANSMGRLSGNAVFEVTYINFNQEQMDAFQHAVEIWESLLQSDVPIRLSARMTPLSGGTIGSTSIPTRYANFDNAQLLNTFYAVSMAEKMAGYELNGPEFADISMQYNSNFAFYFGTDADPPGDKYDFVSIVLHEIGHGLGFFDGSFQDNDSGLGYYNVFGPPIVYDRHIETASGDNMIESFTTGTTALGDALTGDDLFFDGFSFINIDQRPKLYAPSPWNSGSSISHVDESTYPPGNLNSLMSPQFGRGEAIHDPGFAYEMLQDLGWIAMDIDFDLFLDSEDSITGRVLTLKAKGDNGVGSNAVNLHYTYADFSSEVVVNMTPTGVADEFTAIIPATGFEEQVSYYINVDDQSGRSFTSPGEAPQYFWQFTMAKDTIAPEIDHKSLSVAFLNSPVVSVPAAVIDNIGVGDLMLTYKVNSGSTTTIPVPVITSSTANGFYEGEYLLDWDLATLGIVEGDTVKYKLQIQDQAAIANITSTPETGFNNIQILDFNEPVVLYENNFNTPTTDFAGAGFVIGPETGFDSDAIHSDHPYRVVDGTGENDSLTLIYLLKTPIVISETNPSMIFDEVVLVEPGTAGTNYGDEEFWDYAVVEGSNDFGLNWSPLADGYDSREQDAWLTRYNSSTDASNNSTALGDKGLYFKNEIDLSSNPVFEAGDTLLIRFRMYIDPFAHAWGWAIDNLQIQVDTKPPVITQITPDYMMIGDTQLTLKSKVVDNVELDSVIYEVDFNGEVVLQSFPGTANLFTFNLTLPAITATDVLKYRIFAVDKANTPNTTILPSTGFFEVPVAVFGAAKTTYINDFNAATDDFIGSNFSIAQADGFNNPAIVSATPYPDSPFDAAEISYLLKYPITLNDNAAWVQYDEVVLVEPLNDQVAFDVSKDGGDTWLPVFDPYDASTEPSWSIVFNKFDAAGNSTGTPSPAIIKSRLFNMLDNSELNGGEEVLIRFRMTVNDNVHGSGWIIDNLRIQDPATGIEDDKVTTIQIYPNPTNSGSVSLIGTLAGRRSQIVVTDLLGKIVLEHEVAIVNNKLQTTLNLGSVKHGIYIISVSDNLGIHTSRIIVE